MYGLRSSRHLGVRNGVTCAIAMLVMATWSFSVVATAQDAPDPHAPYWLVLGLLGVLAFPLAFAPAWVRLARMRTALGRLCGLMAFQPLPIHQPQAASGHVRGVPMALRASGVRSVENTRRRTIFEGPVPHLDLHLRITSRSWLGRLLRTWRRSGQAFADAVFDRRYVVIADEPVRAEELLSHESRLLLNTLPPGYDLVYTNTGFCVTRNGWHFGASTQRAMDIMAMVSLAIHTRRKEIRPAGALLAHERAWRAFALEHQIAHVPSPLAAWGLINGAMTSAYAEIANNAVRLRFSCALPQSITFQLDVEPEARPLSERECRRKVLQTGVPEFDARFRVLTNRNDLALRALRPIAEPLARLARAGTVQLSASGIAFLPSTLGPPDAIYSVLAELQRLAAALCAGVYGERRQQGIFR